MEEFFFAGEVKATIVLCEDAIARVWLPVARGEVANECPVEPRLRRKWRGFYSRHIENFFGCSLDETFHGKALLLKHALGLVSSVFQQEGHDRLAHGVADYDQGLLDAGCAARGLAPHKVAQPGHLAAHLAAEAQAARPRRFDAL